MVGEKMDKEEKYSNRMRLPKDGAILAVIKHTITNLFFIFKA